VQNARALPEIYRTDFLLLLSKSLIKAIEARLTKGRQQAMVDEALREGYVLTPYFSEQLPLYEKQQEAMRIYFPDMVNAIDLRKKSAAFRTCNSRRRLTCERRRVSPPRHRRRSCPAPARRLKTPRIFTTIATWRKPSKPTIACCRRPPSNRCTHRRIMDWRGIAVLQRDPELAERLFQKAVESSPEPQVHAWSEVYLGRLSDAAGERAEAVKHYKQALAVEGGSAMARDAAQKGMQQSFQKKQ